MPRNTASLLRKKMELLATNPFAPIPNVTKLQSRQGYRLRVGDWRVIYEIDNDEVVILVLKIFPRGEVYR